MSGNLENEIESIRTKIIQWIREKANIQKSAVSSVSRRLDNRTIFSYATIITNT